MEPSSTQEQIRELGIVRKQINLWRTGSVVVITVTMVTCVGLLWSDSQALINAGPTQQIFVDHLSAGINENVVPRLREVASRQLSEMQPIVQKEFIHLNTRVPEVTQASLKQLEELQKSLPERSGKVLDETFDAALRAKEPEIKKMFPDATEEQVKTFFTNLGNVVAVRSQKVAMELMQPHVNEMSSIHKNLVTISTSDKSNSANADDWEMGLAIFDVLRDDLKGLSVAQSKTVGNPGVGQTKGKK